MAVNQTQMKEWMKRHADFMEMMEKCQKEGKYCKVFLNDEFFKGMLETYGYIDFPFQAGAFLNLWKKRENVHDA